jgi:formiminoglutamate deiminase
VSATTRYWCELAWLGGAAPEAGVLIEVDGGVISSVATGVATTDSCTVFNGLTLPGLVSAHSHSFQRALRGRTEGRAEGSFWTWRESMYELAARLDEERVEALARATFAEMALAGITLVGEFDYIHHSDAILRAADAVGIRVTLIDACYLHGGIEAFRDGSAADWVSRVSGIEPGQRARLGVAIHSVRAVDPESAAVVAGFASERGLALHAHVSEQPAENEGCLREHGLTPTALLAGAGALGEHFTAVHATHLTDDDVRLLIESGSTVCMCPTTERDLADGIGVPGGRFTLGSDSNAVIDVFEEARAVELDRRLATGVRGLYAPDELARAATCHGYDTLGWPGGGRITVGAPADFVAVGLGSVRLAGTRSVDTLDAVVFAGSAADVSDVVVDGRVIVRDGTHVTMDVAGELRDAIAAVSD